MDFRSIYQHGFARVAACTGSVAVADPPTNAEMVLRGARECAEEGVVVALFPEMTLTGYSIEDLLLQDAVLDDVERALATVVDGSADICCRARDRRAAAPPQPDLQLRGRHPPRRDPRRRAQVVPADLPGVLRAAADRLRRSTSAARSGSAGPTCRSAPTCCSPPTTCPASCCTSRSARTCGCRCRRAPRRPWPARPSCSNLSGSPITVGRAEDRQLLCRSASSRCLAAYVYAAAGQGESSHRPVLGRPDDDLRERRAAGRVRAFPGRRPRTRWPTSTSTCCARSGCRMGTFDDNRRAHADGRLPPRVVHARSARRRHRAAAERRARTRSCRPTPRASPWTATRPTTSRSPGCSSGCARSATRRS